MAQQSSWSSWWSSSAADKKEQAATEKGARQEKAIIALRELLQSADGAAAAQQLVQGGELQSPDDITSDVHLRRWLIAREWDVELTYKCIVSHAGWRHHMVPQGRVPEHVVARPLSDAKVFLQGVDSQGRALGVVRVANHVSKNSSLAEMKHFTIYALDAMVALCDSSLNPGRRVVSLFDMTGASMANMDVACIKMVLGMLNTHYVERLAVMYFYNPPLLFWGLWNGLKGLLPEATRNKLKVVDPSDVRELLEAVPPEVLPKECGGAAELLPIDQAVRRFQLPPWDKEGYVAPHISGEEAAAAVAAAAAAADEDGEGEDGGGVEARLAALQVVEPGSVKLGGSQLDSITVKA